MVPEIVKNIYNCLDEKKAIDIRVLDISSVSPIGDYFIIASAGSTSQTDALCEVVSETMHKSGFSMRGREGNSNSGWVLMDFGDIIVHIFSNQMREFYSLEHTWNDATVIDL